MQIAPVSEILAAVGLNEPVLNALVPNVDNYTALLFQPPGNIEASVDGVCNRNRTLARRQFGRFLEDARTQHADLAVTPEYSMPWEVLIEALRNGNGPADGELWALGCESIRISEIDQLRQDFGDAATLIHEPLQQDGQRFTDPLAYVFRAPRRDGHGESLVILVQFKTHPMGDPGHFEINGLQRGTTVYQFGGNGQSLRLLSLICSDAFAFLDPQAQQVYDRALIIHIQLNPSPRHVQYRQYRDRLFRFQGDQTELICLNWAKDVQEWSGGHENSWNNVSASAWYLKPDKFDKSDDTLAINHRRGLYYTWLKPMFVHALFFNFEPAVFMVEASKVAHLNVAAAISRRRGPQLAHRFTWDSASSEWTEQAEADDGFASILDESGQASADLKQLADANPLFAERVLALCAGKVHQGMDWHKVQQLDSCGIELTEIINRVTFCQDTDPAAKAFRQGRLRRCANLWSILIVPANLPRSLADLENGFQLAWSSDTPHQNVLSSNTQRATVIYMGDDASEAQAEATAKKTAEYLGRSFTEPNEIVTARQRLAVWFCSNGAIRPIDPHRYTRIDQSGQESEFDIGREQ